MTYEKAFATEVEGCGFIVDYGTELLGEVVEHPHVVVAEEEVYLNAAVGQF